MRAAIGGGQGQCRCPRRWHLKGFNKHDLPFIGDKTVFTAVLYAGWLMDQHDWQIPLAAARAVERYDADEKAVVDHIQQARARACCRTRVPAV